jgi:putative membrane protein
MAGDHPVALTVPSKRGPVARFARARRLPVALALLAVAGQITYPLLDGDARDRLTLAVVLTFATASAAHAVTTRGLRTGGAAFTFAAVAGFVAEMVGVATGVPFGAYTYGSTLGPELFGVPLVVGLAWAMVAWPAAIVARRLATGPATRVLVGAWALASWDLFLDPQLVDAGGWQWHRPDPHLPGVDTVPLSNHAGWLLVAAMISAALQWRLRADPGGDDAVPTALYLWTYVGSIIALAGFLGLLAAAAWGALGMGLVAVPLARSLLRRAPSSSAVSPAVSPAVSRE